MNKQSRDIDPRDLRNACGAFATGVTVISTRTEEGDHGMTANAFMSVSLDPPMIAISLDHKARMLSKVRASGRYCVSVLSHGMEGIAWHFAGKFDPEHADPFTEIDGMPVVPGAASTFVCDVDSEVTAGDHVLFIGRVRHLAQETKARPLVFHSGKFGALADQPGN